MKIAKVLLTMGILSFLGIASSQAELQVGAAAPTLTATDQDGNPVDLGSAFKDGFTLVFFYPKADTPGCTKQACSLRDSFAVLKEKGVRVFGVSFDKPADQKKFVEKYSLPFTLLADPEGKVVKAFGVPAMGSFARRQAYLIRDGKVVWVDTNASTAKQAEDVLAAIAKLP